MKIFKYKGTDYFYKENFWNDKTLIYSTTETELKGFLMLKFFLPKYLFTVNQTFNDIHLPEYMIKDIFEKEFIKNLGI